MGEPRRLFRSLPFQTGQTLRLAPLCGSRDDRIEDMAKGLCSVLESDQKLVGPLMQHYRCLAVALASAFDPV